MIVDFYKGRKMKVQIIVSDVEQELFLDWEFSSDGKPRANSFGFPDDKTFLPSAAHSQLAGKAVAGH